MWLSRDRHGLSKHHYEQVLKAIRKRRLIAWWATTLVVLAVFFGWMGVFALLTDWLEHRWDLFEAPGGLLIAFILGYGLAFTSSVIAGLVMDHLLIHRQIRNHLRNVLCPWCGYDLSSLDVRICPECGRRFPHHT